MRQIGTLPRNVDPRILADHLLSLGITNRIDERPDGWAVWIHNEDHLAQARDELEAFRQDPTAGHYNASVQTARARRQETERRDREYRRNFRSLSGHWDQPNIRRRPLTSGLIAVSVAVFLVNLIFPAYHVYDRLAFTLFGVDEFGHLHALGLRLILRGEVWRLITPIFIHFGPIHLLFNMWALWVLGSLVEARRGVGTLALVVLLSALVSNMGEYVYDVQMGHQFAQFGGMSGVVYAIFGYIWMKGRFEPEQGMMLHPSTIRTMLLWLVICFTGALGPIANAAHVVGLLAGVWFGLARF